MGLKEEAKIYLVEKQIVDNNNKTTAKNNEVLAYEKRRKEFAQKYVSEVAPILKMYEKINVPQLFEQFRREVVQGGILGADQEGRYQLKTWFFAIQDNDGGNDYSGGSPELTVEHFRLISVKFDNAYLNSKENNTVAPVLSFQSYYPYDIPNNKNNPHNSIVDKAVPLSSLSDFRKDFNGNTVYTFGHDGYGNGIRISHTKEFPINDLINSSHINPNVINQEKKEILNKLEKNPEFVESIRKQIKEFFYETIDIYEKNNSLKFPKRIFDFISSSSTNYFNTLHEPDTNIPLNINSTMIPLANKEIFIKAIEARKHPTVSNFFNKKL